MEGVEGKEERSFLHLLCWQYRSSSLRQMVITLVLRVLPLQSRILDLVINLTQYNLYKKYAFRSDVLL